MSDVTPCFIAFCKCGSWIAVAVDEPELLKDNAKSISSWMRSGYKVEKCIVDDIRTGKISMCTCKRRKTKQMDLTRAQ